MYKDERKIIKIKIISSHNKLSFKEVRWKLINCIAIYRETKLENWKLRGGRRATWKCMKFVREAFDYFLFILPSPNHQVAFLPFLMSIKENCLELFIFSLYIYIYLLSSISTLLSHSLIKSSLLLLILLPLIRHIITWSLFFKLNYI